MPYKLFKVVGGWKVGKKDGSKMSNGRKYASNKPLSKEKAAAQMKAIIISEKRSAKGIFPGFKDDVDNYFDFRNGGKIHLKLFLNDNCKNVLTDSEIENYLENITDEKAGEILALLEKYKVTSCNIIKEINDGGDSGL